MSGTVALGWVPLGALTLVSQGYTYQCSQYNADIFQAKVCKNLLGHICRLAPYEDQTNQL